MSCEYYKELISAALDGELQRDEQSELEAHLEACADCRQFAEDIGCIHDLASSTPPIHLPGSRERDILRKTIGPASFWSRLCHDVFRLRHTPRTLAWAGSLVVLLIVGSMAVKMLGPRMETTEIISSRPDQGRPVLKVQISDSDIVATRSALKVSLSDEDIVKSTTLILSGDEM